MPENAIAIIGIGYVGLPLALVLARHHADVIAYDVDISRIEELRLGIDRNDPSGLPFDRTDALCFTNEPADLTRASAYIVTVPTPIDGNRRPDLAPVREACAEIARVIEKGDLVILESTVYPGVTEEVCGPLIADLSGLVQGTDFKLGYSPERVNPGDRENTVESVVKIVAGQDPEALDRVAAIYGPAITAGLFMARSIQVAEAAKVVENVQRDINIALMNELALIFDRMGIRTSDVIDAAATKWNFQKFTPGLVGGHCIGVDPYYLISRAEGLGYYPEVIRAARRLNNGLADFVAQRTVDLVVGSGRAIGGAKIGVLGLTFKENVSDVRNSQSPAIVRELGRYGAIVLCHDPHADAGRLSRDHGVDLSSWDELRELDAMVVTVPHRKYLETPKADLFARLRPGGIVVDVKSSFNPDELPETLCYWSL
ncbi:MAG: UDP-N-acetyl-D-galactosamine dehydrogenase [Rhodospirillaceae bacterium]|nr:UDP-N-acetyl-D-galactosamine dehydrogenase [Rhodospirillaceae bacterium]